jgi:hypothetical protein
MSTAPAVGSLSFVNTVKSEFEFNTGCPDLISAQLSTRSLIAIATRLGIDGITLIVYLRIFSLFSPFAFLR